MVELSGHLYSPNNRTKRPRSSEPLTVDTQSPKKLKINHPLIRPPQFWDNLSQSFLTKHALWELDHRNSVRNHQSQARTTSRQHRTRNTSIKTRQAPPPCTEDLLSRLSSTDLAHLRRLARHGGPDLRDLRGHRAPSNLEMKSTQSRPIIGRRKRGLQPGLESDATPNTTITKTTGPYDRAFEQHLLDHNIYPDGFVHPNGDDNPEPENLDEIREVLEQRRKSLSPSRFTKDDFKNFRRVEVDAKKERQVAKHVIPIIEGDVGDRKCAQTDIAFANLSHLTDGSLVYAKPDVYYGARPTLLKKEIRAELSNLIIPSTAEELPILANNTLEFKGPDGSSSVADRQATYNGALGSRAMRALQTYRAVDQPYDNKAYTLAWTYQAGQLKAFANHPIASSPGMPPGYVMTQINTWAISGNRDAFCRGVAAFRNGRDWAKSQRDQAIERANDIITKATTTDLQHKSPTTEDCFENTSHVTTSNEAPTSHHSTDTSEEEFLNPAKRARTQGEQASNVRSNQGD